MAPNCRFDPQQISIWSDRTNLHFLSNAQREEAYVRARPFLLEQMGILLQCGWERNNSDEVLFDIYKPRTTAGQQPLPHLIIPYTFNHFLDTSRTQAWRKTFENTAIFKATKQKGNNVNQDLYIASSRPLSNIFYLLQALAPGMLVIYHKCQLTGADVKTSRILPRPDWIQKNSLVLMKVMGSTEALLTAAQNRGIAFYEKRVTRPHDNSHRRPSAHSSSYGHSRYDNDITVEQDWTACDKDCGWCGRCWGRLDI